MGWWGFILHVCVSVCACKGSRGHCVSDLAAARQRRHRWRLCCLRFPPLPSPPIDAAAALPINAADSDDIITQTNTQSLTPSNFTWRGDALIISLQVVFPQGGEVSNYFCNHHFQNHKFPRKLFLWCSLFSFPPGSSLHLYNGPRPQRVSVNEQDGGPASLHFINANEAWKLSRHVNEINPNVPGIN